MIKQFLSFTHPPTQQYSSVRNYPLLPRNGYIWKKKKKRLTINPLKERWAFWSPSVSNSGLTERNKSQLDASCLLGHLILYVYVVFELVVSRAIIGQRGTLPVTPLGYLDPKKVIFRTMRTMRKQFPVNWLTSGRFSAPKRGGVNKWKKWLLKWRVCTW